jgi:hypothetical protein
MRPPPRKVAKILDSDTLVEDLSASAFIAMLGFPAGR